MIGASERMQFHLLSFEGPDAYSRAGGIATRVDGLSRCLAFLGLETHLWFVGDPELPGHEEWEGLRLHRWCQWISRFHPNGVYQDEENKRSDYSVSLAPFLLNEVLLPGLRDGRGAVVLAEEWHTADAVLELDRLLREAGVRKQVALLWNANNLFGFDRIPWSRLAAAAVITTVSRAMRSRMEPLGVSPIVIPNGLPPEAYATPNRAILSDLSRRLRGRTALAKVARWDPDKNWLFAVRATRLLREENLERPPLLIARGGVEAHESEVREIARSAGLRWVDAQPQGAGARALLSALDAAEGADILCIRHPLDSESSIALFRAVAVVLADSLFEPFGLVGLEAMAAGGVACTRLSGEDYAIPGRNALVLQTEDPRELCAVLRRLREHPDEERALRRAARFTAQQYSWPEVVKRVLMPRLELLRNPAREARPADGGREAARPGSPLGPERDAQGSQPQPGVCPPPWAPI
jgi:glycosyltransferase involved in cell wall biosynthesis